jgi:hypothetical protein
LLDAVDHVVSLLRLFMNDKDLEVAIVGFVGFK